MAEESLHEITGPLAADCIFRGLKGSDCLGQPFNYDVEVLSRKVDLDPLDMIGKDMSVGVNLKEGKTRYFHGIISDFLNAGVVGGYQLYQLTLKPWFWLLSHSLDSRIFQELSVPAIFEKVLKDKNGFSDYSVRLNAEYSPKEYCVQYQESDFSFVSRLMEQEGIYYYFLHEKEKHTLVIADSPSSHPKLSGNGKILFRAPNEVAAGEEHIYRWKHQVSFQPGKFATRDFDYNKPSADLEVRLESSRSHPHSKLEKYEYPGHYTTTADGNRYLKIRNEEYEAKHSHISGVARSYNFFAGVQFELSEHPRDGENAEYTVFSAEITLSSGEIEQFSANSRNQMEVVFIAIPKDSTYRSPRTTIKPIIAGPQTAIVVGADGKEIWTDKLGRVKVQFPWDREGKKNEKSSCWIRVSQIWSGKGWGSMHIPRIGQEVIVEFLEGDPNQPLIIGRVYNGEQGTPYDLPTLATQSGLKSRSTPEGDKETFNELRFEDKKDNESIYFHAEKDFERVVENNDTLKVGFVKKDKGDQTIEIYRNQDVKIGTSESDGGQTIEIWKDQKETIHTGNRETTITKGNDTLTVSAGNRETTITKGNDTLTVSAGNRETTITKGNDTLTISAGNQTISIPAGNCEITAGKKIVLTVGGSSIEITPTKILIKAATVSIQADMKAEVTAATTDIQGSAMVKIAGGIIKMN
ncbi:MAG: type VI secretion system tip protein VgrG [Pirellula sp.]|nr:type VI secretion system tip protein VgrG [Pirellula sp.]